MIRAYARSTFRTIRFTGALPCHVSPCTTPVAAMHSTSVPLLPMKPGTPIPGLDFIKGQEPPVALERSEYPEWINHLTSQKSLAQLRRMSEDEATDEEKKRYLKLTRRILIKQNNEAAAANAKK